LSNIYFCLPLLLESSIPVNITVLWSNTTQKNSYFCSLQQKKDVSANLLKGYISRELKHSTNYKLLKCAMLSPISNKLYCFWLSREKKILIKSYYLWTSFQITNLHMAHKKILKGVYHYVQLVFISFENVSSKVSEKAIPDNSCMNMLHIVSRYNNVSSSSSPCLLWMHPIPTFFHPVKLKKSYQQKWQPESYKISYTSNH
jgi:hypothetical protein